ncbi:MAG: hypothetical protein ACK5KP_03075 [Paludibacteraceae bacterium]
MSDLNKTIPYSDAAFATEPTKWTQFLRNSFLYQVYRFIVLALKVLRIVAGGHS